MPKRFFSVGFPLNGQKDNPTDYDNSGSKHTFPKFIPDDPEKPHLSSRKNERKRQEVIKDILKELLKYKSNDWTQDKIQEQESMFDKTDEAPTKKAWRKLAQNLLYIVDKKNVVQYYSKNRHKINDLELEFNRKKDQSHQSTMRQPSFIGGPRNFMNNTVPSGNKNKHSQKSHGSGSPPGTKDGYDSKDGDDSLFQSLAA